MCVCTSRVGGQCLLQSTGRKITYVSVLIVFQALHHANDLLHERLAIRTLTEFCRQYLQRLRHVETDVWYRVTSQLQERVEYVASNDVQRQRGGDGLSKSISFLDDMGVR